MAEGRVWVFAEEQELLDLWRRRRPLQFRKATRSSFGVLFAEDGAGFAAVWGLDVDEGSWMEFETTCPEETLIVEAAEAIEELPKAPLDELKQPHDGVYGRISYGGCM